MGGECGTYRVEDKYMQGFGGENCRRGIASKTQASDWRIILKSILN
jgi:hypothetical protein